MKPAGDARNGYAQRTAGWAQLPSIDEALRLSKNEILEEFGSSQAGLTSENARQRLKVYGRNEITIRKKRSAIVDFLLRFKNPLVVILLIAGTMLLYFSKEVVPAIIIFSIVLMSVVLDFVQERRAGKAAEQLKKRVATTTTAFRDGNPQEIELSDVVPGDIVCLSAGSIVPADARVISAKDFFVDQSALTGESFPVEKTFEPLIGKAASAMTEWNDYLFMGTSAISGSALALVVRTGSYTQYGGIAKRIAERRPETEFERGLKRFGYLVMQVTFALVLFVFFLRALIFPKVLDSFLFAVSLAVGLTPELLPMIVSVNLSKGAIEMAKKGVIVKRLASIQNFGSMDTLCTDKTGTITENRVTLKQHIDAKGRDNEKALLYSYLNSHYRTGVSTALDDAILKHKEAKVDEYQKIDEVPFDFTRKRVSVIVKHKGETIIITKGAPEEIVKVCTHHELNGEITDLTKETRKIIEERFHAISSKGLRLIAVAYKKFGECKPAYSVKDESDLVFLGFDTFTDPPKRTAKKSLQLLKRARIELKIVTGDNELVTQSVCEQIGFEVKGVLVGNEIDRMSDEALAAAAEKANIFARVTPAQKDRIINVIKRIGHVVGFMGDGINDAPSMRVADVSISVSNAVDIAKETADIILSHKDLTVLARGVLEGRKTFGNTMKYMLMGMSSNFGNMFSAAGASLFLPFLPMQPVQILLNNLMYDVSEISIPTDNVDKEYLNTPKRLDISFVRNYMLFFGPISSIFDFLTFGIMLFVFNADEHLFQTAWFLESLWTQTLVVFVIRTRKSPFLKSRPSKWLFLSSIIIVLLALMIPFTSFGGLFGLVSPPSIYLAVLVGLVVSYLILAESLKWQFFKRYGHRLEQSSYVKGLANNA